MVSVCGRGYAPEKPREEAVTKMCCLYAVERIDVGWGLLGTRQITATASVIRSEFVPHSEVSNSSFRNRDSEEADDEARRDRCAEVPMVIGGGDEELVRDESGASTVAT